MERNPKKVSYILGNGSTVYPLRPLELKGVSYGDIPKASPHDRDRGSALDDRQAGGTEIIQPIHYPGSKEGGQAP